MFIFEECITTSGFIRQQGIGFAKKYQEISVCLVEYDKSVYSDSLSVHFMLPFPDILKSAVTKRRAEYLAGRYAARQLLQEVGYNGVVATGADRAPIWPIGWRGSISHTETLAIAVLTPNYTSINLGVDIEIFRPYIIQEIANNFATDDECALLTANVLPFETMLHIVFSAKESLFKALYPLVHHIFDFEVAKLCEFDSHNQSFTLELTRQLSPSLSIGYRTTGHYMISQGSVITMVVVSV